MSMNCCCEKCISPEVEVGAPIWYNCKHQGNCPCHSVSPAKDQKERLDEKYEICTTHGLEGCPCDTKIPDGAETYRKESVSGARWDTVHVSQEMQDGKITKYEVNGRNMLNQLQPEHD